MRVRKRAPDGDYSFGSSELDFLINSPAAVAQVVQTRLLLYLGEWYLDTTQGFPWLEGVIGKHSQDSADQIIQDYIRDTTGSVNGQDISLVLSILEYTSVSDPVARNYSATAKIDTIFGPTTVTVTNERNL